MAFSEQMGKHDGNRAAVAEHPSAEESCRPLTYTLNGVDAEMCSVIALQFPVPIWMRKLAVWLAKNNENL